MSTIGFALAVVAAVVVGAGGAVVVDRAVIARLVARVLRRRRRQAPRPEWCSICGAEIRYGWVIHATMPNEEELGAWGGTGMSAFYCRAHRPDGAVAWPL